MALVLVRPAGAYASTLSYTGQLASPEDIFQLALNLGANETVTFQTYGFGGGANAAGNTISAGGFDPLVAVFSGTGGTASLVQATSDTLSNYGSFEGCPPAGTVTVGSSAGNCGDIDMQLPLSAGVYTVLLSDADYFPNAVFDNGTLGEGFFDLTGGAFQTCVDANDCNDDSANWALDITTPSPTGPESSPVPEPATLILTGVSAFALVAARKRRIRQ
jgi:hypothetical protein